MYIFMSVHFICSLWFENEHLFGWNSNSGSLNVVRWFLVSCTGCTGVSCSEQAGPPRHLRESELSAIGYCFYSCGLHEDNPEVKKMLSLLDHLYFWPTSLTALFLSLSLFCCCNWMKPIFIRTTLGVCVFCCHGIFLKSLRSYFFFMKMEVGIFLSPFFSLICDTWKTPIPSC